MFDNYQFAYAIGDLFFALPWLILFYCRKDLRREMLVCGITAGIISVIAEPWFLADYWRPENLNRLRIALGDFLFGFFPGGVACVIYEGVFRKKLSLKKISTRHWQYAFLSIIGLGTFLFFLFLHLGLNSMYAASLSQIILATMIVVIRRDLFFDVLLSSILFGAMAIVVYKILFFVYPGILEHWWLSANASGTLVIGIPIEELAFEFSLGAILGPLYEFVVGKKFKKGFSIK